MESTHADIIRYFEHLDLAQIDQRERDFKPDTPCSVDAHLAHVMGVPQSRALAGSDAYARLIGGNRAHAILLLRSCGAPHDPFTFPWEIPPAEVFRQAAQINDLPTLRGADLSHTVLSGTDLRGMDFSYANLSGASLTGVDVPWTNFSYADLSYADMQWTDVSQATLVGADLTGANLTGSSLPVGNLIQQLMGNAVSWGVVVGLLLGVGTGSVIVGLVSGIATMWMLSKLIDG